MTNVRLGGMRLALRADSHRSIVTVHLREGHQPTVAVLHIGQQSRVLATKLSAWADDPTWQAELLRIGERFYTNATKTTALTQARQRRGHRLSPRRG